MKLPNYDTNVDEEQKKRYNNFLDEEYQMLIVGHLDVVKRIQSCICQGNLWFITIRYTCIHPTLTRIKYRI